MDSRSRPLKEDLKRSFYIAAETYRWWRFGGPEPNIAYDQNLHSISSLCRLVLGRQNEEMPPHLVDLMDLLPSSERSDLLGYITQDCSYHAGAECLLQLVTDKKKQYGIVD
jgi:hypothetical protein